MIKSPKAEIEDSTEPMPSLSVVKCFYTFKHRVFRMI